ncbi:hypothetical protein NDU88_004287 [Pleurodeles waltl]|uniref:Uncharacterized protein n=1 Tax=Pleurodeles waltl TaxID=8319 RepID=A0AAV7RIB4_PLEWA|nr:hypothetical protein NDU88_004287 [Pleurodeles waltl]
MHCSVFSARQGRDRPSTSSTSPLGRCSVPRSSFSSIISSPWAPGLYRHCRRPAHSVAPSAHTGALSDALQCVLCQARARPPLNVLYKSPGAVLRTSVLVLQRYFLVVGAGPAPTSPADRALRRALSAHGHFIRCTAACSPRGREPFNVLYKSPGAALRASFLMPRCYFLVMGAGPAPSLPADRALRRPLSAHGRFIRCTAACSLPSRGEIALQRPPLASARAARIASPRKSPASTTAASPAVPAPARPNTLRDRNPPRSSGPLT